jgi:hypothetical protein
MLSGGLGERSELWRRVEASLQLSLLLGYQTAQPLDRPT